MIASAMYTADLQVRQTATGLLREQYEVQNVHLLGWRAKNCMQLYKVCPFCDILAFLQPDCAPVCDTDILPRLLQLQDRRQWISMLLCCKGDALELLFLDACSCVLGLAIPRLMAMQKHRRKNMMLTLPKSPFPLFLRCPASPAHTSVYTTTRYYT